MRGIWLEKQKIIYRDDLPLPEVTEGEALIKMKMAGICSTDLEMIKGYYPFSNILGHEFVGEVVSAPGHEEFISKRVVGEISIYCGNCEACQTGNVSHCLKRRTLGIFGYPGVFADFLSLPLQNLHIVPDSVSDKQAVFTELLAAALEILQQVHVKPTTSVLVVGAGRLGILIAQCFLLTGCDLKVIVRREKTAQFLEKFGIPSIFPDQIKDKMADIVVEVTGSEDGFNISRRAVKARGILVLKSTFHGNTEINLSSLVVEETTVIGSRCGPFAPALRLLEANKIDVLPMIDSTFLLSDGIAAINHAAKPGVLKVLLRP